MKTDLEKMRSAIENHLLHTSTSDGNPRRAIEELFTTLGDIFQDYSDFTDTLGWYKLKLEMDELKFKYKFF